MTVIVASLVLEAMRDRQLKQALVANSQKVARERNLDPQVTGAAARTLEKGAETGFTVWW